MSDESETTEVFTLTPPGNIVSDKVAILSNNLAEAMENHHLIELDMKNVTVIDSSGIGALIAAQNKLHKRSGKLKIVNAAKDICTMFKIMRLDSYFEIGS